MMRTFAIALVGIALVACSPGNKRLDAAAVGSNRGTVASEGIAAARSPDTEADPTGATRAGAWDGKRRVLLEPAKLPDADVEILRGSYTVFENRQARRGRTLDLDVVVLPATGSSPKPDPVFMLAGGPGQAATSFARWVHQSRIRQDRDIVLVDQRGTGGSHRLDCDLAGSSDHPQRHLEPVFQQQLFRDCLEKLKDKADLTQYTTPIGMDDLNDVRAALGYEKINLSGGSYGTRAALVYMRRHPETVRTAVLRGVAPIAFRNPLYHAREAQWGLERTFEECEADKSCSSAFPELRREFGEVMKRLEEGPATVDGQSASNAKPATVRLTKEAFAGALRVMMYYGASARRVPLAIHRAYGGDYTSFVRLGVSSNRNLRSMLAFGMLLSVTCPEDLARIHPDEIARQTKGTFLGDGRVRRQIKVCEFWPKGKLPEDYGQPVRSDVPTLLFSGSMDPVTSPRFGEEAARYLSNSLHLVVPTAHDVVGECVDAIIRQFLHQGSVGGIDTSCVSEMKLPPFEVPDESAEPSPRTSLGED